MQKALNRVRPVHGTDPRAEARVRQAVAKAANGIAHHEGGIRRVRSQGSKGNEVAYGRHDGHAALAEPDMNAGIGEGGDGVADKGGEEDEGDDGVREVVVFFELSVRYDQKR